jgi:hypothetical protein
MQLAEEAKTDFGWKVEPMPCDRTWAKALRQYAARQRNSIGIAYLDDYGMVHSWDGFRRKTVRPLGSETEESA